MTRRPLNRRSKPGRPGCRYQPGSTAGAGALRARRLTVDSDTPRRRAMVSPVRNSGAAATTAASSSRASETDP